MATARRTGPAGTGTGMGAGSAGSRLAMLAAPLARHFGRTSLDSMLSCTDFDLILAEVLHRAELPAAAQEHLAECGPCTALLNDIETIAESVRQLPMETPEPVPNLWPQIREALRQEGVIHADGRECGPGLVLVHRSK